MDNYSFKVIAELRDDLTNEQKKAAINEIDDLQKKLEIIKIDDRTYCKSGIIKYNEDFGAVTFFFCKLKRIKEYFSKLEYYDMWDGETRIAV